MNKKIKFGIIGCSRIAERSTIPAIFKSAYAELEMIGSRTKQKAKQYAEKFGCKGFGSYEDVLNNDKVDAVYISVPISLHAEWATKSAESGKHVLCEKSSSTSFESAKQMVDSCKKNNVRIMEGFMFRFHPQHKKVLEIINKGQIGKLFTFNGMYGFPPISKDDIRYQVSLGGGVFNDVGCYPICASRIIFGQEPHSVQCNLIIDPETGVDIKGHAYLVYDDKAALVSFGFDNQYQANYKIWGSKGTIELNRAYAVPPDFTTKIELQTSDENTTITNDPADHFAIMVDSFCKEITLVKKIDYSFEDDLVNQARVMEALRLSNKEKRITKISEIN